MISCLRCPLAGALLALPLLALAPAGAATAQESVTETLGAIAERVLTEYERQVIRDYYRNHGGYRDNRGRGRGQGNGRSGLPPGLAKKDRLPPGLERQLVEGGSLPPGLQRRALPGDLLHRLPPRRGTERIVVDRDVILIETATGLILDILRGAAG
ncbi:MAG: hypothetical protein RID91_00535 [Azospirillaceae bacterium]